MALDQLVVLLVTYLIRNVHVMAGVRGCSNWITKSIYNQQGKKNTHIPKDPGSEKGVEIYFQCINKWQLVCMHAWLFSDSPKKDGVTYEDRTVSTVLPADGCWEYLLHHIMSQSAGDSPKSKMNLISSVPALYTAPARYIRLRHMKNGEVYENNWTTALWIFGNFGLKIFRRHRALFGRLERLIFHILHPFFWLKTLILT